jgi:hypothetical protein
MQLASNLLVRCIFSPRSKYFHNEKFARIWPKSSGEPAAATAAATEICSWLCTSWVIVWPGCGGVSMICTALSRNQQTPRTGPRHNAQDSRRWNQLRMIQIEFGQLGAPGAQLWRRLRLLKLCYFVKAYPLRALCLAKIRKMKKQSRNGT